MKTFSMTISGDTLQEFANNLVTAASQFQITSSGQEARPLEAPRPSGKSGKAEDKTAAEKTAEKTAGKAAEKTPAQTPGSAKGETALDYQKDVAPKVFELADKKGRQAAIDVLKQFGVEKAHHLSTDQYPEFVAALDAALAAED